LLSDAQTIGYLGLCEVRLQTSRAEIVAKDRYQVFGETLSSHCLSGFWCGLAVYPLPATSFLGSRRRYGGLGLDVTSPGFAGRCNCTVALGHQWDLPCFMLGGFAISPANTPGYAVRRAHELAHLLTDHVAEPGHRPQRQIVLGSLDLRDCLLGQTGDFGDVLLR
jgi:hypothetical protein